ncbi:MAG: ATP-binding protein [Chloroflexi bacterium]|nr:ATP-binding protein [Chloroflexota bacterium]
MINHPPTNGTPSGDAGVIHAQVTPRGFSILDCDSNTQALFAPNGSDVSKTHPALSFEPAFTQFLTLQLQPPVPLQYSAIAWKQPFYTTIQTGHKDPIPVRIWIDIISPINNDEITLTIEWQKASSPPPHPASPSPDHLGKATMLIDDHGRIIGFDTNAQRLFETGNTALLWNNTLDSLINTHNTLHIRDIYAKIHQNHSIISLPVYITNQDNHYTLTIIPLSNKSCLLTFRTLLPTKYPENGLNQYTIPIISLTELTVHNLSNHIAIMRSVLAELSNSIEYARESWELLNRITQYMEESIDSLIWQLHSDNITKKSVTLVQVDNIISESHDFLLYRQKEHIPQSYHLKIVEELQSPPPVYAHAGAFRDSIINLLNNAVDATINGGNILARSEYKQDTTGRGWTVITISDTGAGIAENAKIRLFEPLFTTKQPGHGTGLGLVALQGTILLLDGYIEIESIVNQGTTVRIGLPCAKETPRIDVPAKDDKEAEPLNLLLVEDEPNLREALTTLLESAGHRVTNAGSYAAALQEIQRLKERTGLFDTIILDISLPDGSGWQLADLIHHGDPHVFILLTSGYYIAPDNPNLINRHLTIANVFRKPHDIKELCSRLRRHPFHHAATARG